MKQSELEWMKWKVDRYNEKYQNRELYERTKTRQNITLNARNLISVVLACLFDCAPKVTGYGAKYGIKLKRVVKSKASGKLSKYRYHIIIGSEAGAKNHQFKDAPYIAWQNEPRYHDYSGGKKGKIMGGGYYEGWVEKGIAKANNELRKQGAFVLISGPFVVGKYPSGGTAGYLIEVSLLFYEQFKDKMGGNNI